MHRERDVLHHHQHVRHLVVKIMQLTISMNICSYEELLSSLLKLQCHLESLLRIQENHKITAIPARMRLMWLLRMSLWLKTWRQKFYSCVYLCGSEQGNKSLKLGYACLIGCSPVWDNFCQTSFHQNVEQVEENADSADDNRERTMYGIVGILMVMIIMILMMRMIDDYDYEDDCEDDHDINVDDESDEDDVKSLS